MLQEGNYEKPSRSRVCAARFVDVGLVSSVVLSSVYQLGIEIYISVDEIPDGRIGESIRDQLMFLTLYLMVWLLYELGLVRLWGRTLGMMCVNLALLDSADDTKKASLSQLWKRMMYTLRRLVLVVLAVLIALGIEAIFLISISLVLWSYLSDPKNLKSESIDQKFGTRMVYKSTKISLENKVFIWVISIFTWAAIFVILLISTLWLLGQPLQERQYRNRILVLEDQLEYICQSPSLVEYCP